MKTKSLELKNGSLKKKSNISKWNELLRLTKIVLLIILAFVALPTVAMDWKLEGNKLLFDCAGRSIVYDGGNHSGIQFDGFNFFVHIVNVRKKKNLHNVNLRVIPKPISVKELSSNEFSKTIQAVYRLNVIDKKKRTPSLSPNLLILDFQQWRDLPILTVSARVINKTSEQMDLVFFFSGPNFTKESECTGTGHAPPYNIITQKADIVNQPGGDYLFVKDKDKTMGVIGKSFRKRIGNYLHFCWDRDSLAAGKGSKSYTLDFVASPKNYSQLLDYASAVKVLSSIALSQKGNTTRRFRSAPEQFAFRDSKVEFFNDRNKLYVTVECTEPTPEKMVKKRIAAGDPIWLDDCVEMSFISQEKNNGYIHLLTNSLSSIGVHFRNMDKIENCYNLIKASAKVEKDHWKMEWEIPLSLLDQDLLKHEKVAYIHINREVPNTKEYSGWPTSNFHKPKSFGRLLFSSYSDYLNTQLAIAKRNIALLRPKLQVIDPPLQKQFMAISSTLENMPSVSQENYFKNAIFDLKMQKIMKDLKFYNLLIHGKAIKEELKTISGSKLVKTEKEFSVVMKRLESMKLDTDQKKAVNQLLASYLSLASGGKTYAIWAKSPWTYLAPETFPTLSGMNNKAPKLTTGIGEFESVAFAVTNFTAEALPVKVEVAENAGKFKTTLRRGFPCKNKLNTFVNNALPLLDNGIMTLPPNSSIELWLTIDTTDANPGEYKIKLNFSVPDEKTISSDINVKVYPVKMQQVKNFVTPFFTPVCQMMRLGKDYMKAFLEDLEKHYVRTFFPAGTPKPVFSDEGKNLTDYTRYDALFKDHKPGYSYITFWGFDIHRIHTLREKMSKMFGAEYLSDKFNQRWKIWLNDWMKHLKDKGVADNYYMMPFDETTHPDAITLMKMMRETCPEMKLAMTVTNTSTLADVKEVAPIIDLVIPHFYTWRDKKETWEIYKKHNVKIAPYFNVQPCLTENEPYSVYRRMAWLARNVGSEGCGTWVHYYQSSSEWSPVSMNMVQIKTPEVPASMKGAPNKLSKGELIIPSKRWEAWREGAEDYFYMCQLENEANKQPASPLAKEADALIKEALASVCDDKNNSSEPAEKYKIKFLELLTKFRNTR